MAMTRTTFTLSKELAEEARRLGVNVSAAARRGVGDAVGASRVQADRVAYQRFPEQPDPFWTDAEAWGGE